MGSAAVELSDVEEGGTSLDRIDISAAATELDEDRPAGLGSKQTSVVSGSLESKFVEESEDATANATGSRVCVRDELGDKPQKPDGAKHELGVKLWRRGKTDLLLLKLPFHTLMLS